MTSIAVHVESKQVTQSLTRLGEAIPHVVNADIQRALELARDELAQPGKPSTSPVHWDSEKQRRAYFATDGFGAGIPYKRTGEYERGWQVKQTGTGTAREFTISNKTVWSKYVGGTAYGKAQSNIHAGRWPLAQEVVKLHVEAGLTKVRRDIHDAIHSGGYGI
jgi:hypothetical protein